MQRLCGNIQSTLQRDCSRMKLNRDVIVVLFVLTFAVKQESYWLVGMTLR